MRKRSLLFMCVALFSTVFLYGKVWQLTEGNVSLLLDDETGLMTVKDDRSGCVWTQAAGSTIPGLKRVKQKGNSLILSVKGDVSFEAVLTLLSPGTLEVTVNGNKNAEMKEFAFPAAFQAAHPDFYLVNTDGEGILIPLDDTEYPLGGGVPFFCGGGLSMAWMGITDFNFESGYMVIADTPFDVALQTKKQDGLICFEPVWFPCMGKFGYERKVTFCFFDTGGYVAQCKKYREYIWKKNSVVTLREKEKRFLAIRNILGAPHIYVWDTARDVEFAKDLKRSGIERAFIIWNPNHTPYPEINYDDRLRELGYASGGYELFSDSHPRDTAWYELDTKGPRRLRRTSYPGLFESITARKKDGTKYSNRFGTYICPAAIRPQIKERVERELAEYPHDSYFLDVYQANGLYECYSADHPLTREGYAQEIIKNHRLLEDEYNQFLGGEWGADYVGSLSVYVHGMMTLQRTWFGSDIEKKGTIYYYGDWKNNSRPTQMLGTRTAPDTYLKFSLNEYTRVPLYELVYHDAIVTSWRWEDANHHNPEIWWKKDLFNMLYGSAPLWTLDREQWEKYQVTFAESYEQVCTWLQKICYDEMINHSFITPDHTVQMTEFSSGHKIVVNFGNQPYEYNGQIVGQKSYLCFSD